MDPAAARALGRSLGDFAPLSSAETILLDAARRGVDAVIATVRPSAETDANRVRADFVRFLALGGDADAPVHEHGVQLIGGWLTGALDLDATTIGVQITLVKCVIGTFSAYDARFRVLALDGSRIDGGFLADRLTCDGGVFIRDAEVAGGIRLPAANVGGDVDIHRSAIGGAPFALLLAGAKIGGSLYLRDGFAATGEIFLVGAQIDGNLECQQGKFDDPGGNALMAESVEIKGNFGFNAITALRGRISLHLATIGVLIDDRASWAKADDIILDGLTYGRFGGDAPTDAASRIAWLDRQIADHLGSDFRPQPWEQAIATLRASGHADEARTVAIAKQDRLRAAGKITGVRAAIHRLYGGLIGYGYKPEWLLGWAVGVWIVTSIAFWIAVNPGAGQPWLMAPAKPAAADAVCVASRVAAHRGDPCLAPAPEYATFFAPAYALDVLLPVINLGYKNEWEPVLADAHGKPLAWGIALRAMVWAEIVFGWVSSLLLVGVLGNLIKKD